MSMILDALTRAEHERQLEKEPDLKFVTPVKPKKAKLNNLWLWVGLGVLANVLILFFIVRTLTGGEDQNIELAATDVNANIAAPKASSEVINAQTESQPQAAISHSTTTAQDNLKLQASSGAVSSEEALQSQSASLAIEPAMQAEGTPLAMEVNSVESVEVDRPLLYESKQPNAKPKAQPKATFETAKVDQAVTKTKGRVSFSSSELTADDSIPVVSKPKLLIDQGYDANVTKPTSSSGVPNVRDLPESSRTSLNQYEVNVHVFDDDPIRRFVLINMDKYKEGDRIANNGPLVQEITVDGVVVDYGSGRALLPPK